MPNLLVDRTRGWLAEAQKKLQDLESSYHEYMKVLPNREQETAMIVMKNILSEHEASVSQLMAVLDHEETVMVEKRTRPEAERTSREPTVSYEPIHNRRGVFLERTKLPTFSGKVEE